MTKGSNLSAMRAMIVRAVCLACLLAGLVAWPRLGGLWGAALIAMAVGLYAVGRRQASGDFVYAKSAAIVIPDWLGLVLSAVFLAVPIWAAPDWPGGASLHPSVWLMWPMALVGLSILYIGWRSESFALTLSADTLEISRGFRRIRLPYAAIISARPWRRDLPRWMRALVPLLVIAGRPGPAGAVMLARVSKGIALQISDQSRWVIETDGLTPGASRLIRDLKAHGVTFRGDRHG